MTSSCKRRQDWPSCRIISWPPNWTTRIRTRKPWSSRMTKWPNRLKLWSATYPSTRTLRSSWQKGPTKVRKLSHSSRHKLSSSNLKSHRKSRQERTNLRQISRERLPEHTAVSTGTPTKTWMEKSWSTFWSKNWRELKRSWLGLKPITNSCKANVCRSRTSSACRKKSTKGQPWCFQSSWRTCSVRSRTF